MDDAYARLGLTPPATPSEVRRAYRRAVQQWHPDRHPNDLDAQERFVAIQLAYRWLNANPRQASSFQQPSSPPAPAPIRVRPTVRGDDATIRLLLPLASIFSNQEGRIRVHVAQVCDRCRGDAKVCLRCHGTGQIFVLKEFFLSVPAGAYPCQVLRLPGVGHHGPYFTIPGDICVSVVWTRRGPWHYRHGRLERRIHLSRRLRENGGRWRLKTPDGRHGFVTLPPVARQTWLCVPGLGMPQIDGSRAPLWIWVL